MLAPLRPRRAELAHIYQKITDDNFVGAKQINSFISHGERR